MNDKKKIYISGKFTDLENAEALFCQAEMFLQHNSFDVINPLNLNHTDKNNWIACMKIAIKALCDCDSIYMLSNWRDSKGATVELQIARILGLEEIYQTTNYDQSELNQNIWAVSSLEKVIEIDLTFYEAWKLAENNQAYVVVTNNVTVKQMMNTR